VELAVCGGEGWEQQNACKTLEFMFTFINIFWGQFRFILAARQGFLK